MEYLDLADYLVIAGSALRIEPNELAQVTNLPLAESAVLGWHLIRNHPLPDGNKRAGYLAMIEFAERNGFEW